VPPGEVNNKSGSTQRDCMQDFIRDCKTKVFLHVHVRGYVCMCMSEKLYFVCFIQRVRSLDMYFVT